MRKTFLITILLLICTKLVFAAWPSDSIRTKNWGSEVLTDSDLEAQFDLLHDYNNDMMNLTTGHKHDATANEGPLILLNDNTGVIGVSGTLGAVNGGTGLATITDGGVMLGSGTGNVTAMAVLADGEIIVGDGTTDPVALSCVSSSTGDIKHECGGIEADISAIVKGGIVSGTGAGTMGITTVGTNEQILEADSSAFGGFAWVDKALNLISVTSGSGTNTGDITIAADKSYITTIYLDSGGNTPVITFAFNSDTTGTDYRYMSKLTDLASTPTETLTGNASSASVPFGTSDNAQPFIGRLDIHTYDDVAAVDATFHLKGTMDDTGVGGPVDIEVNGRYSGGAVTSFELQFNQSTTYIIRTYELGDSI